MPHRTIALSKQAARLLDSIPRGMKSKVIEALLKEAFERFNQDPEEVAFWALKRLKEDRKRRPKANETRNESREDGFNEFSF